MRFPLKKIKQNDVCAEIGVWQGEFSDLILSMNPLKLFLIDPWQHQDYKGRLYNAPQLIMDRIYDNVKNKFKNNPKVQILRNFSTEVYFENSFFDWVYIDGNHSYSNVVADLDFYFPLIKSGGYLCGDDYGWSDKYADGGPKRAVDEFIKKYNARIEIVGNQFVINKD